MRWGAYASEPDEIPLTLNMASLATLEVCESMCEMLSHTEMLNEVKAHRSAHDKLSGASCSAGAGRPRPALRTAAKGHKDQFPRPSLSGRCRLGEATFAAMGRKEEDAPIAVVRRTTIEPRNSILSGSSASNGRRPNVTLEGLSHLPDKTPERKLGW